MAGDKWEKFKQEVLDAIDAVAFCEAVLGPIGSRSDDEITCLCNFHEDTRPSMCVNTKSKVFDCHACGKTGSLIDIWMQHKDLNFKDALLDLGQQNNIAAPQAKKVKPPIDAGKVTKWHNQLMSSGCLAKKWLNEKRGLLDEVLTRFRIGWDGDRNTIPIQDERGNIVNVRRYNAKNKLKMINYVDGKHKYGSPARLYGINDLVKRDCEEIFITEGEWDRILMEQHNFPSVTGTHGCKTFRPEWGRFFSGRKVRIVYDCDAEGRSAVEKTVLPIFAKLEKQPAEIKVIWLPLEGSPQSKDITDYFIKEGFTAEDFRELVNAAEPIELQQSSSRDDTLYKLDSLAQIDHTDYIDKRVEVELTVCGETSETFHAPTKFRVVRCSEMDHGKCFDCKEPIELKPDDPAFIGICMSTDDQVERLLRQVCCDQGKRPKIEILDKTIVREFFANQRIERNVTVSDDENEVSSFIDGAQLELVEKKIYLKANPDEDVRDSYRVRGWVRSHPKTQQVVLLADEIEPLEESFEKFEINDETREHLKLFQDVETIGELLKFLSERITRVYQRDDLLLGILLTLCSVRKFRFQGEEIRGWVCMSVIGDSGTAKSQSIMKLSNWTGIGDVFSGLTGSRTGLAYGLREHKQKGWQVKIGRYPANTRKMLIVDEAQEIEPDDLKKIGKAMDEGWMQIDRIASNGYEAQTRLIALANPKNDRILDEEGYGCRSLMGVFSKMMIRRLDLCLFASASDIKDSNVFNRMVDLSDPPNIPMTAEAMRSLIFFAWSRSPRQVQYSRAAERETIRWAEILGEKFGYANDLPIVHRADFRKTLARLAVAMAVLNGNITSDYSGVVVLPDHVDRTARWIDQTYTKDNCSLQAYSAEARSSTEYRQHDVDRFKEQEIERAFSYGPDQADAEASRRDFLRMLKLFRSQQSVRATELADLLDRDRKWVSRKLSKLNHYQLIRKGPYGYYKTAKFKKWLLNIETDESYRSYFRDSSFNDSDLEDLEYKQEKEY